jgi:molybdopterin adenylyltransferase
MSHAHEEPGRICYRAAVLVASTKGAVGQREDTAGPLLAKRLTQAGFTVETIAVVSDDRTAIAERIRDWIDSDGVDLVITCGGTGLSPNDVTPEATRDLIERDVPGLAEAIRAAGREKTPHADLSRGLSGLRKESLIINLPGSPKGAMEGLETVLPALGHALDKAKGDPRDCAATT